MRFIHPVIVICTLTLAITSCSKSTSTQSSPTSQAAPSAPALSAKGHDCLQEVTAADLSSVLTAPVTVSKPRTDPETCDYETARGASVSLVVREGDDVEPNWQMSSNPRNAKLDQLSGVGDKALELPDGTAVVAVKGKVLCSISLIGIGSGRTEGDVTPSRKNELAHKLGALCDKIFVDRS